MDCNTQFKPAQIGMGLLKNILSLIQKHIIAQVNGYNINL